MRARGRIAAAAVTAVAVPLCGGHEHGAPGGEDEAAPGYRPVAYREPVDVSKPRGRWLIAHLRRSATLRASPGGRPLADLRVRTEFGSPRTLSVLRRRSGWLAVLAPELGNGRPGWLRADAARLDTTDVSVRVVRSRRELELLRGAKVLDRLPVSVGRPANPTPLGRFAVTDRLHMGGAGSVYGCCALALSGHQPDLPRGWPGGNRLAIHGTPDPRSIGRASSIGCIRAHTAGLRLLMRRVPLGAPVFVTR